MRQSLSRLLCNRTIWYAHTFAQCLTLMLSLLLCLSSDGVAENLVIDVSEASGGTRNKLIRLQDTSDEIHLHVADPLHSLSTGSRIDLLGIDPRDSFVSIDSQLVGPGGHAYFTVSTRGIGMPPYSSALVPVIGLAFERGQYFIGYDEFEFLAANPYRNQTVINSAIIGDGGIVSNQHGGVTQPRAAKYANLPSLGKRIFVTGGANEHIEVEGVTREPFHPNVTAGLSHAHDMFLLRMNPSTGRKECLYMLGGSAYERAYAMDINRSSGVITIAGRGGRNAPTTPGALMTIFGPSQPGSSPPYGEQLGYIANFDTDCNLIAASYFGVTGAESGVIRSLSIDPQTNDIFITGAVRARDAGRLPAERHFYYGSAPRGDQWAIYVARLSPDLSESRWVATFYGSQNAHGSVSISTKSGRPAIASSVESLDFPTSGVATGPMRMTPAIYMAQLSPDGSELLFGQYVVSGGITETGNLTETEEGVLVLGATTVDTDFVGTDGSRHSGNGGRNLGQYTNYPGDNVLVAVNPRPLEAPGQTGQRSPLVASTIFGTPQGEAIEGIVVTKNNDIYFAGGTYGGEGLASSNAAQTRSGGAMDAFYGKIHLNVLEGRFEVHNVSYLGGDGDIEAARGIATDDRGEILVLGVSNSRNFPTVQSGPLSGDGVNGLLAVIRDE